MTESLCRPDDEHWCIECCRGQNCSLFGETGDGKEGCLAHDGPGPDGLKKREICFNFDCTERMTEEEKAGLRQKISQSPRGKFNMGQFLPQTGKEEKVSQIYVMALKGEMEKGLTLEQAYQEAISLADESNKIMIERAYQSLKTEFNNAAK